MQKAESVGEEIKKLRQARGLSLRRLADSAGIAAATLSRWETQKRMPSITELNAVLHTLDATAAQKKAVLQLMDVTRAVRALRQEAEGFSLHSARISRADLLWAMRHRKGCTQAEAARGAGVAQSQITRWENGDTWPDGQKLHALCWALSAEPEEVAALTAGVVTAEPSSRLIGGRTMPDTDSSMDLVEWMNYLEHVLFRMGSSVLVDLTMLAIESRLRMQAEQQITAAKVLLPAAYAVHARLHLSNGRIPQAAYFGQRGIASTQHVRRAGDKPLAASHYSLWFGNVIAVVGAAKHGNSANQRHAVGLMKRWLPELPNRTDGQWAWGMGTVAPVLARLGRYDEAIALSEQSCHKTVSPQRGDVMNRCLEYLRLMLEIDRPNEAVKILELGEELEPTMPTYLRIRFRQAHDQYAHALRSHTNI